MPCRSSLFAMAEGGHKACKGSSSSDTLLSGEPTRPVGRPNVDRVYPTGMGLRPKAYPRPPRVTGISTRDVLPVQGPVDRCLTIVRAMNIDTADDNGGYTAGPVEHAEASGGALTQITSNHDAGRQEPRPGQSACRNRAQSGWDVMPLVPKCGMPCLMCGAPCNRTRGRHFIRQADDNPAHLCFHHDLHELYGE